MPTSKARTGARSSGCWRSRTSRRKTRAGRVPAKRMLQASSGIGGYPFVGSPDEIAEQFANLSACRLPRARGVVRELSQRRAVFLRRGAAAPGAAGASRRKLNSAETSAGRVTEAI